MQNLTLKHENKFQFLFELVSADISGRSTDFTRKKWRFKSHIPTFERDTTQLEVDPGRRGSARLDLQHEPRRRDVVSAAAGLPHVGADEHGRHAHQEIVLLPARHRPVSLERDSPTSW